MARGNVTRFRLFVAVLAVLGVATALYRLEAPRAGLQISELELGASPARLYTGRDRQGPLVIVAHGFAGSLQMMEAYSLTLARAGYTVVSFDFQGHGRNPVPMSGDVTAIEGTTARLVAQTRAVLAEARSVTGQTDAALLGHSMASDVIVRAAMEDPGVSAIVAISMYSEAVTATFPERLLILTGAGEPHLRRAALAVLAQVSPAASEGVTVQNAGVVRKAVVAPGVEHVGVLHSQTALREARAWLNATLPVDGGGPVVSPGPWVLLLLTALVLLAWPLSALLGPLRTAPPALSARRFAAIVLVPAILTPVVVTSVGYDWLPVRVIDYLAVHLLVYGGVQLVLLGWFSARPDMPRLIPILALVVWGLLVFGAALDRYGASFWPNSARWTLIAVLAVGAIPAMLSDSILAAGRPRGILRMLLTRLGFLGSLVLAVFLDGPPLFFLVIAVPVILLFFLTYGLMGRWVLERSGPTSAGVGLGLILAWAIGVSVPMFLE
ncbi:MAG: alpha/beta fold hydrolase [Pseudomonadota bacterium]